MQQKILVVDDAKSIVDILKFNLKREGFNVLVGYDGEEAVDIVNKENPDLILLDIIMPEMDGISAFKEIKKIDPTSKIVFVSALEESEVLGQLSGEKIEGYIQKPFNIEKIRSQLSEILEK